MQLAQDVTALALAQAEILAKARRFAVGAGFAVAAATTWLTKTR